MGPRTQLCRTSQRRRHGGHVRDRTERADDEHNQPELVRESGLHEWSNREHRTLGNLITHLVHASPWGGQSTPDLCQFGIVCPCRNHMLT
jgi:hypothetical protein